MQQGRGQRPHSPVDLLEGKFLSPQPHPTIAHSQRHLLASVPPHCKGRHFHALVGSTRYSTGYSTARASAPPSPACMLLGPRARALGERSISVPCAQVEIGAIFGPVTGRIPKSYLLTVLFSLFNAVPNIVSLAQSGFLPVSVLSIASD